MILSVGLCRTFDTTPPFPCPNSQICTRSSCLSSPTARFDLKNSSIRSFCWSVQSNWLNSSCRRSMQTSGILQSILQRSVLFDNRRVFFTRSPCDFAHWNLLALQVTSNPICFYLMRTFHGLAYLWMKTNDDETEEKKENMWMSLGFLLRVRVRTADGWEIRKSLPPTEQKMPPELTDRNGQMRLERYTQCEWILIRVTSRCFFESVDNSFSRNSFDAASAKSFS